MVIRSHPFMANRWRNSGTVADFIFLAPKSLQMFMIIIIECYKHLYDNELNNLREMNKFMEIHNFIQLNQEKIDYLKRLMTSIKTE